MNEYEIYQKGQEYSKRQIRMAKIDKIPVDVYLKYVKDGNEFLETCMSPISNFMEIGNKETKYANETFKFRNGSTLERTLDFLNKGEGFTRLEALGYHIPEKGYISNFGIQVHEQSYQMSEGSSLLKTDSVNYANMASSNYGGRPVIIEGEIPSQYVFQQQNQHEFAIPKDYYDRITSATIKDANTGDILYTYKNGQLTNLIKEIKDTNQIVNQVKSILIPPNWENEGKNETLNKEYKALLDKYFGSYIDDLNDPKYTDAAILKFATKDEGYQAAFNIFKSGKYENATLGKKNIGLNLIKNNENVILDIHGSEEGKVVYEDYTYKVNELIQRLEDTGLIPEGTKQIYTMSCYGGLQEKGLTASGIPFESSHTSLEPTIGYGNNDIFDNINDSFKESFQHSVDFDKEQLEDYTRRLEEEKEKLNTLKNEHPDWTDFIQTKERDVERYQKEVDFYKKELTESEERLQKEINYITKSNNKKSTLVNLTKSGNTTDKYKQDVLDSFKKYGDDFAKAEFIAEPKEIENALWYLISQDEHKRKLEDIEFHEGEIKYYKGHTRNTKNTIASYEERLQKAKESNNTEEIEEYTDIIKDYKKDIKRFKDKIEEHSTIVYKDKLQLQEFDEKDKLYGKDYKAKSNFPSSIENRKEDSIQFIEPLTWDEITASKEYKEYRESFDFFLGMNKEEIESFYNGSTKYNDQRLDMLEKAKALKEKMWEPYKKNAKMIHIEYDNEMTNLDLSKIVTNDDLVDAFEYNIFFPPTAEAVNLRKAAKSKRGITKTEIESLFNYSIDNVSAFTFGSSSKLEEQLGDLKYDYHLNPYINKKFINNKSRSAFYKLYKNADELSPSQINKEINNILRYNAESLDADKIYNHGLIAYGFGEKNVDKALQNLQNIIDNPKIQISTTEDSYHLGEMGVSGKGTPKMYYESDFYTKPTIESKRHTLFDTIDSLMESISSYSEYVVEDFQPERLWVKEDFYKNHKDEVNNIANHFNFKEIDLIEARFGGAADLFDNATVVSETIQVEKLENTDKKLTPQEAFDKYGPDDDRFYTSQGLDPKEQRTKINELNSKRKPVLSNEEILEQLHKETEEAAEQFYNTAKEVKNSLDNISNQLEDIKSEPKEEPTIKTDTNTEQTVKNTVEEIKPNTEKLENKTITETVNNTNKLENRTIQDTAKKSLNTKKLGIAIAGATIAVAGITAMASNSKKKKDKEKYVNKTNNINTNTNNSYIDYSNDLQYANQITSYSRGHSTYSL